MSNEKLREAQLLYKILEKHPRILKTSPNELIDKIEQLKRGLPKENEFTSLCLWMNKCALIHKLDQEQMPKWTKDHYQVPDLFIVFRNDDTLLPVLVEVKSTEDMKLTFSGNYYKKIKAYARLNRLPILIAWKVNKIGMWFLVDIDNFEKKQSAYHLDFGKAMVENLLSFLVGDFSIHFRPGIKLLLKYKKIKLISKEDKENAINSTWEMVIEEAFILNYKDDKINKISLLLLPMLSLTGIEYELIDENDYIIEIWKLSDESPRMILASRMHSHALVGFNEEYNPENIDWHNLIYNEKYACCVSSD